MKYKNMLKEFIKSELDKILKTDYYGTDEQIKNEELIFNKTNIEMKYLETIEEYYFRIYDSL